ncbi:hypothetical protein [Methanobrevibacter sp.]|uniref:hypothetical protein n=1 Tax=Methanobrevibacter sp. TaxID=66852 RepID=UPI0026DF7F99|nr:hypothetical protein [Methanobrevibacter sp.]MDO5860302.1 hypothetical protein [Methanobrevibacter sp.]
MDFKRNFLIILVICILFSISCVSANDDIDNIAASNISDDALQAINEDSLSMDGDDENEKYWYDDYIIAFDGNEDDTTYIEWEAIAYPTSPDGNNVTFKLNYEDGKPLGNVNLGVVTDHDFKISKITTDSNGIAVYNIPFNSTGFSLIAGFWSDGKRVSDYMTYNGKTLYSYDCYYMDITYSPEEDDDIYGNYVFTVLSNEDNETISGVSVVIYNSTYTVTRLTNKNGLCRFDEVPYGDCRIKVKFENETLGEYEITFGSDHSISIVQNNRIHFGDSCVELYAIKPIIYEGNFKDLNNLISAAPEGSTINLEADYIGSGEIRISKNLTINGNNHKIDASSNSRIFTINSTVTLNNIRFCNGKSSSNGGAIYSSGNLNLNNCVFENNEAISGGAVYAYPTSRSNSFESCTFKNNRASERGGAIYLEGSALATKQETTLDKVTFEGNVADNGGAVCSEHILNVADCDFNRNSASNGGAIYTLNGRISILSSMYFINGVPTGGDTAYARYSLNISGKSTFKNNKATSTGGAISIASNTYASLGLYGSLNISSGTFFESNGANIGGAISIRACDANIK